MALVFLVSGGQNLGFQGHAMGSLDQDRFCPNEQKKPKYKVNVNQTQYPSALDYPPTTLLGEATCVYFNFGRGDCQPVDWAKLNERFAT